jgi:hypothetical protein
VRSDSFAILRQSSLQIVHLHDFLRERNSARATVFGPL